MRIFDKGCPEVWKTFNNKVFVRRPKGIFDTDIPESWQPGYIRNKISYLDLEKRIEGLLTDEDTSFINHLKESKVQYIIGFLTVIVTVLANIIILTIQFWYGFERNGERHSGLSVVKKIWNFEGRIGSAKTPFPVNRWSKGLALTYSNKKPMTEADRRMKRYTTTAKIIFIMKFIAEFLIEAFDTLKDAFYIMQLGGGLIHYQLFVPISMCIVNLTALLKDYVCCKWTIELFMSARKVFQHHQG